jgi:alkylation response protein AidB-like acyl-CoA dehydrogenase
LRFSWTDDQVAFRDAARDLLAKECPASVVRAAWDGGPLDRGVWDSLDGMGVLAVLVPEADGGLGLDECSLVPVIEESGRAALPHPIVETALVAAPLGIAGRVVATDLGGPNVANAADADALLLARDGALHVVEPAAATLTPVETVDGSRRAARVEWASGELVTDDADAVALAFDRGALGSAAQLVGLARTMLDLTVAYVVDRHQFGVPIGSFQAVKHHLADALLGIEFAAPAVARAAATTATGAPTRTRDVSMAKALATDAAERCGRAALQCHGAIGYTVEHDLHLYLKRSWALARSWGDRAFHADRVGAAIGI